MSQKKLPESPFEIEMYKQACENCRFYGDMRFKQLTLFGVICGLLFNALKDADTSEKVIAIALIGMITTAVIWVMEVRSFVHWLGAANRKKAFEPKLDEGNREVEPGPKWTFINASNAVVLLYLISYLRWYFLFWGQLRDYPRYAGAAVFGLACLVLLIFSFAEYMPAFRHAREEWKWWLRPHNAAPRTQDSNP